MHFVHSIWTKPLIVNKRGSDDFVRSMVTTVYSNAVSIAYVKHCGGKMNLYADGFGRDMLEYPPYDNIYELKVPIAIPTVTWAAGKFIALEKMELGDVHIDGDVYLKTEKLLDLVSNPKDYDMVVQSIEDDKTTLRKYYSAARNILIANDIKTKTCSLLESPSYNCGTIGFFNNKLKQNYLAEYFFTLKNIIKNKQCLRELKENKQAIPDLILEQQFIYELSKKYKVNNLLGTEEEVYDNAIKLGYQHVLGSFKLQQLGDIMAELKYIDLDLFNKTAMQLKYLI